jgi:hypothetical protein
VKHANFLTAMRVFARRRPFRFYLVELHSGLILQVRHPEVLSLRGELAVHLDPRGDHTLFDSSCVSRVFEEHPVPSATPPERPPS